ncbi:hypothetical protein SEUCBS140593_006546 [Sporothrix eucalyptigena]|uniref:Endonuclease/exonuclease/phosphatase domain-containing protein n=1 Tax=Sporothrix eucalyptigena TaxID=1812306 RepID=A0ABP0C654_9PEZI
MASFESSDRIPPLPHFDDATAKPLDWFMFETARNDWIKIPVAATSADSPPVIVERSDASEANDGNDDSDDNDSARRLLLNTWNIDAFGYEHAARLHGILRATQQLAAANKTDNKTVVDPVADVLFFQEVSGIAKRTLAADTWIRANYFISGLDYILKDVDHPFYNVILLSRQRFSAEPSVVPSILTLGPVWMVYYPSRYNRYVLCCDVTTSKQATLRLANVHLDSLAIRPSLRPRQLEIVSAMLKCSGLAAGLVAGDFNPVIPEEDDGLVQANGLVDCWELLTERENDGNSSERPKDPGFTWGVDGKQRFPPIRMDKVVITNSSPLLQPKRIQVMHPKTVAIEVPTRTNDVKAADNSDPPQIAWSDHSGLAVTFCVG